MQIYNAVCPQCGSESTKIPPVSCPYCGSKMLERQWTQEELHFYVREMGIEPQPGEVIPQGVKFIAWPPPPITEEDIRRAKEIVAELGIKNGN